MQGDLPQGGILSKIGGPSGDNGYQFGIHANNSQLYCQFNAAGEPWPTNQLLVTLPSVIPVNAWTHVACTYDNANLKIYVNGASVGSLFVGPKSVVNSASNLRISGDDNNNVHFNGLIDEPQVFNRALSQTELQSIVAAGTSGQCKIGCTPAPANMVSWWDGSGSATTANDIQGPNAGTLQNGASFTPGKVGQAFDFSGADQVVAINDAPSLHQQQFTMDAWVFPRGVGDVVDGLGAVIFTKDTGNAPGANVSYGIFGPGTTGKFTTITFFTDLTSAVATSTHSFAFNQWYHVAGVWDGSTLSLYIDGVLEASVSAAAKTVVYTSDNAGIGRHSHVGRRYDGLIDEVEFFRRSLSQTEVQSIVAAGAAGKCKTGGQTPVVQAGDITLTFPNGTSTGNTTLPNS